MPVAPTLDEFWRAAERPIASCCSHPFLMAMMDDTLDLEKMKYYVVQDALYLKHFAGCLRMIGKSKRVDTARFESFATGCEHAEMDLQNRFFSVWAIDPNVKPEPNTLLYISYIESVCATKSTAQALSSLLPCFWVYTHVGKRMTELRTEMAKTSGVLRWRNDIYESWIDMYASKAFETTVAEYKAICEARGAMWHQCFTNSQWLQ